MRKIFVAVAAAVLCFSLSTNAFAQNATVNGTVSDASGALIPGVEVTATNVNTGIVSTSITNETGAYTFPSLQPGTYSLSASLPGFQTARYENIRLSQGQQVRFNFALQVGAVATEVQVTTDAGAALATTTASVGDVLPEVEVNALPLVTRDVMRLISTTAGAVDNYFAGQRRGSVNMTRDGLPIADTRFGDNRTASSTTYTSPDLVEEVQVVVGSVDAEGRGSGEVRLQTRSGTNQFRGALFYSNNNSALQAFNYFQKLGVRNPEKSYSNRNQYGGRLGGPIVQNKAFFFVLFEGQRYLGKQTFLAPVLTNEARNGIFRYFPGRRNGNIFSATPSVDVNGNPLEGIGTLASFNLFTDVRDPFRTRVSNNRWVQEFLAVMPQPNDFTIGDGLNTAGHRWQRRFYGNPQGGDFIGDNPNRDQLNLRFDYEVNRNNKVTFATSREKTWGLSNYVGATQWPGGYNGDGRYHPRTYTGAWLWTISPTVLNEFRIGRKLHNEQFWSPLHVGCCQGDSTTDTTDSARRALSVLPSSNGYPLYPDPPIFGRIGFGGGNFIPFSSAQTRRYDDPLLQFSDTLSWTRSNHSLRAGFQAIRATGSGWSLRGFPGASLGDGNFPIRGISGASFSGLQAPDAGTAQTVLNILAGSVGSISQDYWIESPTQTGWTDYLQDFRSYRSWHQNDWSVFFKDTWTVTRNLTVNLGLRYDKFGTMYEGQGLAGRAKRGQAGIFGISGTDFGALWNPGASGGSLTEVEFVGKNSPNPGTPWYPDDWNNVAPSAGFSWSIPGLGRETVLRGGYSINYTGFSTSLWRFGAFNSLPGLGSTVRIVPTTYTDLSTIVLPLTPTEQPFGVVSLDNRTQSFNTFADDRATPYVQNWNLSVQRELARNLTLEVSYIANKATKLFQSIELNEPNIFASWNGSETFLEAFHTTRAGGNAALFNRMLMGIDLDGSGPIASVNGTTQTGSAALRAFAATRNWVADGAVASLANWMNSTNAGTRVNGGLLRRNGFPENFFVVNPQFRNAVLWGNHDNSTYNSLQVQVVERLSQGLSGQFTYVWSKALGNALTDFDTDYATVDPRNRRLNHGRLEFDHTHTFRSHGTWDLPFGPGQRFLNAAPGWLHRVVEGWQLSGILGVISGAPLTIRHSVNTLGFVGSTAQSDGTANLVDVAGDFPKNIGKVKVGDGFVQYFEGLSTRRAPATMFGSDPNQLSAFFGNQEVVDSSGRVILRVPEPGKAGTLGVAYIEGPGRFSLDMAVAKRIRIGERTTFQIRADAMNVLNKPQWGNPNVNINSADFGRITSAPGAVRGDTGARTITINARIEF